MLVYHYHRLRHLRDRGAHRPQQLRPAGDPIVIVPATHLLGMAFSTRLSRLVGVLRPMQWYLILMVVALALACGLIALLSQAILSKRTRNAHLILGIGFSVILALILILDTVSL